MAKRENLDKLQQLLTRRPLPTALLLAELGVSQPTFSRLWANLKDGIALGAGRARQYALRRQLSGVTSPIPIFRVSVEGQVIPIGHIDPLQGGYYALTPLQGTSFRLFQGMPYFLQDLRPQGFLGRMEPRKNRDLDLPPDILRWTDEQVLKYISRRSEHAPGDLICGNESYARYLADAAKARDSTIPDTERAAATLNGRASPQGEPLGHQLAESSLSSPRRSNAMLRRRHIEHVIVKLSPSTRQADSWCDLLIREHFAFR
jgi:hypothetical protein